MPPFLDYDPSAYLVISEGKLVWVIDAYTTSNLYPYSQPIAFGQSQSVNYVRNSVKVTVDAFTGKATFYRVDMTDPIAATWAKAFPGMFQDNDKVPVGIRAHFRYPEAIFTAQLNQFRSYHMTDPREFYNKEDLWAVSQKSANPNMPGEPVPQAVQLQPNIAPNQSAPVQSQYLQFRLPGEKDLEFVLFNSFAPASKSNLIAMMAARSDPENYGQLVVMTLPRQRQINGPFQVQGLIQQDPKVSQNLTLLNQSGSRVQLGQIRIVPVGDSLLYVQPLYIAADEQARPELKFTVVVFENKVVMDTTFAGALQELFGFSPIPAAAPPVGAAQPAPGPAPVTPGPSGTTPTQNLQTKDLINRANDIYTKMQDALKNKDFATYGSLEKELGTVIEQLRQTTG